MVEGREFRDLLLLCREELHDKDIPHRTTIRASIIKTWKTNFDALRKEMHVCGKYSHVCLSELLIILSSTRWGEFHLLQTSGPTTIEDLILPLPLTGSPVLEITVSSFVQGWRLSTASLGHTRVNVSAPRCWSCWTVQPS